MAGYVALKSLGSWLWATKKKEEEEEEQEEEKLANCWRMFGVHEDGMGG
jgi:hypothetical protein